MSEENRAVQENGHGAAPPIFHQALDKLYRWMAEGEHSDGMTTIRTTSGDPGEPPLCADLSLIVYYAKPDEVDDQANLPGV